jgi:translation initiation factor 2 subunit 2
MSKPSYEELLERAISSIPYYGMKKERFKIPEFKSEISGGKTIIRNFFEVTDYLYRDANHLLKFILRECGSKGFFDNKLLVIRGKFSNLFLNKKLYDYCAKFVICAECHKPDTKIISEEKTDFLKCDACGSKREVERL